MVQPSARALSGLAERYRVRESNAFGIMADATQQLNVQITGDGAGSVAAANDVVAAYTRLNATMGETTAAAAGADAAMGAQDESAKGLGASLEVLASHARVASMGLSAIGLDADAAAVKLDALAGVVKGVGSSFGPLLLAFAAIEAAGASLDFFKEGVKDAADFQGSMTSLQTALHQSGTAWTSTSAQVKEYLETMEQATGYTQNEVLAGMSKLVTAGASVRDSEYEMSVAADVAAAKNINITDVTNTLIEAEAGRGQGLARLDPRVRDLIKSHADLFTILQQVERDMSGQAASAADTYEGAVRRLGASWETFRETIGAWLLPWLTDTVNGFIGLGDQISKVAGDLESLWKAKDGAGTLKAGGSLLSDVFGFGDTTQRGKQDAAAAQKKRQAGLDAQNGLDFNPAVGNDRGGSGDGYQPSYIRPPADDANLYGKPSTSSTATTDMMKAFSDEEAQLAAAAKSAGSSVQQQAIQTQYLQQVINDTSAEVTAATQFVKDDTAARNAQIVVVKAAQAAVDAAAASSNNYGKSLQGEKDVTQGQKDAIAALKQAYEDANTTYSAAKTKLDALNSTRDEQIKQLQQLTEAQQKATDAQREANSVQDRADADQLASLSHDLAQQIQLIGANNAQKRTLEQQFAAQENLLTDQGRIYARDDQAKALQDYVAMLTDEYNAHKQFIDSLQTDEAGWISSLAEHTKSLKDVFTDTWKSIEDGYVNMLAGIVAKSSIFSGINNSIFGAVGTGGGNGDGSSTGWLGALTGLAGGSSSTGINSVKLVKGAVPVVLQDTGTQANINLTGSATGVDLSPWTFDAGGPGASAGGGSTSSAPSWLKGALSSVAEGVGISGLATSVSGGNSTNGAIGGAVGGGLMALLTGGAKAFAAANPLIGVGVDLLTSLIGGMFGPSSNPLLYPDQNNPTYAQAVSDINGVSGTFGGTTVNPDSQYNISNGGTSLANVMAQFVQTHQSDVKDLTTTQQNLYNQILALMGGNPNANGGASLGVASEHAGVVTLGDGQTISATGLASLFTSFTQNAASISASTPVYSISRSDPNFNLSTASANGVYDSTSPSNTATGSGTSIAGQPSVVVNAQGATFVGTNGVAGLATTISTALTSINRGSLPGARISLTAASRTSV